jgi:hypothetical protein
MNTAATEAVGAQTPAFTDINLVASEAEIPCRGASALQLTGPGGIFLSVTKSSQSIPNPRGGAPLEAIFFDLRLNPVNRITPGAAVPNCNMDGVLYLPAKSVNVSAVADPIYSRDGSDPLNPNAVTDVRLIFTRTAKNKAATLGIRVKFEEGVGQTASFNPKRANGTNSFP